MAPALRYSNALNFPFKHDARLRLHTFTHVLAQRFYVGAACATEIEEEVAMLFRNMSRAFRETPAACFIDQAPGLVPIRVLEGGTASAGPQGLRFFAPGCAAVHFRSADRKNVV